MDFNERLTRINIMFFFGCLAGLGLSVLLLIAGNMWGVLGLIGFIIILVIGEIIISLYSKIKNVHYGYKEYKKGEIDVDIINKKNMKDTFYRVKPERKGIFSFLFFYDKRLDLAVGIIVLFYLIFTARSGEAIKYLLYLICGLVFLLFAKRNYNL